MVMQVWLENAYSCPFLVVFSVGPSDPEWEAYIGLSTNFHVKTSCDACTVWTMNRQNWSTGARDGGAENDGPKKDSPEIAHCAPTENTASPPAESVHLSVHLQLNNL